MASRSSNTEGKVIGTYSNSFPKLIKYINRCCHFPIQRFVIALTTLVPPAPSLLSSLLSLSTLKHPHNLYKRKNTKGQGSDFFLRILIQPENCEITLKENVLLKDYLDYREKNPRLPVRIYLHDGKIKAYEIPLTPRAMVSAVIPILMGRWNYDSRAKQCEGA